MTFRDKRWIRHGNRYHLIGHEVDIYQWNAGKNANFLVYAGYGSKHVEKSFEKGPEARNKAIEYAFSIKDDYPFWKEV
jgi:hypothetical protein